MFEKLDLYLCDFYSLNRGRNSSSEFDAFEFSAFDWIILIKNSQEDKQV